jgi:hypothetical protein
MAHVAVDLDDVVVDFVVGLQRSHLIEFGRELPITGTWTTPLAQLQTEGLKAAGYKSVWAWLKDREWLWAQFDAVPGAIGGIAALRADGHYVEAVTSKPTWAEHNVWKWLGKWRPPFNRVTIVSSKDRKVDFTDAGIIIDDKLETCVDFNKAQRSAVWFNRGTATLNQRELLNPFLRMSPDWTSVLRNVKGLG